MSWPASDVCIRGLRADARVAGRAFLCAPGRLAERLDFARVAAGTGKS